MKREAGIEFRPQDPEMRQGGDRRQLLKVEGYREYKIDSIDSDKCGESEYARFLLSNHVDSQNYKEIICALLNSTVLCLFCSPAWASISFVRFRAYL